MGSTVDHTRQDARVGVLVACLVYTVFFVYGSLVPLNWTAQTLPAAWEDFVGLPGPQWRADDRIDVAVNFLLTLPLAFAVTHLAATGTRRALRIGLMAGVWPLLALLSLGVEFAQLFFPPRDPSWTDVAAQWGGTAAGIAAYLTAGGRFRALLAGLAPHHRRQAREQRWLYVYLGLLVMFSVMPLDLSLSPGELYRKWKSGGVVLLPFGALPTDVWQMAYELATDIALWAPVGLMWRRNGLGASVAAAIGRTVTVAVLVEFAQMLVVSRISDITDVLLAGVGAALGATMPGWLRRSARADTRQQTRWLAGAAAVWFVIAMLLLWSPFNFDLQPGLRDRFLQVVTRMPFETYFFRGEFGAFNELVRKFLVSLPGGLLVGAWAFRRHGVPAPLAALWGLWGAVLLLEAGQLLLPGKVPDLTDAALGCFGAWVGWRIARSLAVVDHGLQQGAGAGPLAPVLPQPSPVGPAALAVATPGRAGPLVGQALWGVGGLALAIWMLARLPGLPYNMAKLVPGGAEGALAALGLATASCWILAVPLGLLAQGRRCWSLLLPVLLGAHGLLTFAVLRATVPLPMLHKVIGSPVLAWGGVWEDIVRFLALHACVMLPLLGAALLVRVVQRPSTLVELVVWGLFVLLLAWPVHWVVVERAATDNLIELMRGRGSLATTAALTTGWGLLALAGSALAAATLPRRRAALLALAVGALALAPLVFDAGLEPVVVKYERVFSALQFIVSAERSRYATGAELAMRAAVAMASLVLAVAVVQVLAWRALAVADARLHGPSNATESGA